MQHLDDAAIARLGIDLADVADAVGRAFRAHAAGRAAVLPAGHLDAPGRRYTAKGATLDDEGVAVLKWYGMADANAARGLRPYHPIFLVNELDTGVPLATLDGQWATLARTAASSTLAARLLARPDADRLAVIGCGAVAWLHVEAWRSVFPLREVACYSRRRATAEAFAARVRASGLEARVSASGAEALRDAPLVVSAIGRRTPPLGYLAADMLMPGAFVAMPDMGYAFAPEAFARFGRLLDDAVPAEAAPEELLRQHPGPYDAHLPEAVAAAQGGAPVPGPANAPAGFVSNGSGLADAAIAALVAARAGLLRAALSAHRPTRRAADAPSIAASCA